MPFALLMLDLDAFKAYNDTHGHPAGDALLARIATAMRDTLRDDDRVYRYGGDEFAIILPQAGGVAAREIADRVRAAVAKLTEGAGPVVTVSVGIAVHPDDGATKDQLVAVADRALYLAKPPSRPGPRIPRATRISRPWTRRRCGSWSAWLRASCCATSSSGRRRWWV